MHNQKAIVYRGDKNSKRGAQQKWVDYILIYVLITVATWNFFMQFNSRYLAFLKE